MAGVILTFAGAICWAEDEPVVCADCHGPEAGELGQSVHHALQCRECHGGEGSYSLPAEEARAYRQTVGPARRAFEHGPSFLGKPARLKIPALCGDCHADVERMNPYGLRTDQLARYLTSGHGKTLAANGDERVAVCVDCHGSHAILPGREPGSRTHPLNVPDTCGVCHADAELMGAFDLPVEVVEEYRDSVHGRLLHEQQDIGSPTCATCHGNHSAMPPGFAAVGAVCGQCHQSAAEMYAQSIHADQPEFAGCIQCHGGGEGRHFHLIERITQPPVMMIRRYARLRQNSPDATTDEITAAIHPEPKRIMNAALPMCLDCHDELEDDESLQKLFELLDRFAEAERSYVTTGQRLAEMSQGVLLVDAQQFLFEDAKTHLIELSPVQHSLDVAAVMEKAADLQAVCVRVDEELAELQAGLNWRHRALGPIWAFAIVFATVLYIKYKRLKAAWVKPLPDEVTE